MKPAEKKRKKIVFATPPLSTEERYGVSRQSGGETMPLGLASLAAVTRNLNYDTAIVDAEILGLSAEQTAEKIIALEPDYVGFTAVTISINNAGEVVKILKSTKKDIVCIIGGHHLAALPEETMNLFPDFDIGVIGEGEKTLEELLNALNQGIDRGNLAQIKGLIFRKNGQLFKTEKRERIKDLDSLPTPAWDLLPDIVKYYCPPVHTVKRLPAVNLVTSRGCPGKCLFCARTVYGSTLSYYSAPRVIEMVKELYNRYGIREIQFRDDEFLALRKRLSELCHLLIKEKLDLVWSCTGRVDFINPEVLALMKRAGCWQIWYGIESGSQQILDTIKKQIKLEETIKAVEWTNKSGIEPCGFFMMGSPGETRETLQETIDFALKLKLHEVHVSFTTPFPGSELYTSYKQFGTFENNWKKLNGWTTQFVPYGLTKNELKYFSNKFFRKSYFRPITIWRYFKKIRSMRHLNIYFQGFLALLQFMKLKERKQTL